MEKHMAIISKKLSAETDGESGAQNLPLGREPKKKWFWQQMYLLRKRSTTN